jgi:hypothetical protein
MAICIIVLWLDFTTKESFSNEHWLAEENSNVRLRMVDDLQRRYDMHGWNMNQVKELLGTPYKLPIQGEMHFLYPLGSGWHLAFKIDDQEIVIDYFVFQE